MNNSAYSPVNLVKLAGVYFLYFGLLGVFIPFLGVFLDDLGHNSEAIGTFVAMMTVTRIVGPNLWAHVADSKGNCLQLVQWGGFLATVSIACAIFAETYIELLLVFACYSLFWTAIMPQVEVITMGCAHERTDTYSKVRLWGSIGFIALVVLSGALLDVYGPKFFIPLCIVLMAGIFITSLWLKEPKRQDMQSQEAVNNKRTLSRVFICFIMANLMLQVSFGPFYGFFALYMKDLGYSGVTTGWLIASGVIAEVLVFIYAGKVIDKFGVKAVMILCLFATSIRWLMLGFWADSFGLLLSSQLIHGLSFALMHAASMHFVHSYFGIKQRSRGQALYSSLSFGVGGAVGNFISGQLWDQGAGAALALSFAAACSFAAIVFVIMMPNKQQHT